MIYARGTGDGIAWNGGERGTGGGLEGNWRETGGGLKGGLKGGTERELEGREKGRKTSITEINLPALIVKNNRFLLAQEFIYLGCDLICSGTYLPGLRSFCRLPWHELPEKRRWRHRLPRIHSRQTLAAVASGSPLPGILPLP